MLGIRFKTKGNADRKVPLGISLFLISVSIAGSFFGYFTINKLNNISQQINPPPIDNNVLYELVVDPQLETDFDRYKTFVAQGKFVSLENLPILSPSFSKTDTAANNELAKQFLTNEHRSISLPREIKFGYLYIKAKASGGALSNKESIYVYLNSGAHGGHLLKSQSLISIEGQYLYKLSEIPFTTIPYSDNNEPKMDDWLFLLNSNEISYFGGFVSTVRGGQIDEVVIAYE